MKAIIGSISEGTLRPEDLAATFADTLEELDKEGKHKAIITETREALTAYNEANEDKQAELEENLCELVDVLQDALNDYAAPYFYFGAKEGDGASFGFWFDSDSFENAARYGEVSKGDNMLDAALNADRETVEYLAVVSDHGNVALYDLDGNEIWAIV